MTSLHSTPVNENVLFSRKENTNESKNLDNATTVFWAIGEHGEFSFISQLEIAISVFTSAKMNCTKGENDTELNLNGPNTAGVKIP